MTPVLLDVTRLTSSSALRTATGIDRVVRAYLFHFLADNDPVHFLGRIGRDGFLLLDRAGMAAYLDRLDGSAPWAALDIHARLRVDRPRLRRQQEAELRRRALWFGPASKLEASLQQHVEAGFSYINPGHLNLTTPVFSAVRNGGAAKTIVLIHDTIPLDHPEWQTSKSVKQFADALAVVSLHADVVVANSHHTADRAAYWFSKLGREPDTIVAHLGVDPPVDVAPFSHNAPYFVLLGTIEPRKGHDLMLDVWDRHSVATIPDKPHLFILGRRGWMNEKVFEKLDSSPLVGRAIFEIGACNDVEKTAYLKGAAALLFPSRAEGFGMPLFEAVQLGTPVLASDLPVFREFDGLDVLYMNPRDVHKWAEEIAKLSTRGASRNHGNDLTELPIPRWDAHFEQIRNLL